MSQTVTRADRGNLPLPLHLSTQVCSLRSSFLAQCSVTSVPKKTQKQPIREMDKVNSDEPLP